MLRYIYLATASLALSAAPLISATEAQAQKLNLDGSAKNALAGASDKALDRLAEPGAFSADEAIRIALPGPLKKASGILRFTNKAGLTGDLTKSMNDAAGFAAREAKPIFRAAIDKMTLRDGVGILTGGNRGGTQYLRKTSGVVLGQKLRPLIASALHKTGAFKQLDKLGSVSSFGRIGGIDLSKSGLTDSVTEQALDGIFVYIGREEGKFRKNPLRKPGRLLEGIF